MQDNAPRRTWPDGGRDVVSIAAVLLLWVALWTSRLHGPIDFRWDASTYYVLGTALAEGKGYRLLNEPGEIEAVQYPPLLPMLVAAHQRALGTADFQAVGVRLRVTYFLVSGVYLLAVYALARVLLEPSLALVATAGTGLSFYSYLYPSDSLYAEIPFALTAVLFLLCLRYEKPGAPPRERLACRHRLPPPHGGTRAAGRLGGGQPPAASVRPGCGARRIGRLAGTRVAGARRPGHRRPGVPCAGLSLSARALRLRQRHVRREQLAGESVSSELGRTSPADLAARVGRNLLVLPRSIGESAWIAVGSAPYLLDKARSAPGLPVPPREVVLTLAGICLAAVGVGALLGAIVLLRRGEWRFPLFYGITLAMVCLTPWPDQFWRYLAPLTPCRSCS